MGSTYNFAAHLYLPVIEAFGRGDLDEARQHQARATEMVDLLVGYGALPAFKATMSFVGPDCGPVRLPLVSLSEAERDAMREDLDAIGFFRD